MSNEQEHHEEHASPIKTPKQLIVTIVLSFLVPIIIIIMLVNLVMASNKMGAGSDSMTEEAVARRIAPVAGFELVDANAPRVFQTGEQVYQAVCTACHTAGVANAPKLGDTATWAPLIKAGFDSMLEIALHGKGAMPPKGGNPALSDYEVARAVVYMANESGGSFEEPAPPAQEGEADAAKPDGAKQAAAPAAGAAAAASAPAASAAQTPAPAPAPAEAPKAEAPKAAAAVNPVGEKLYKTACFACHGTGVANAPKLGDKAAWEPYLKTGMDAMVKVAITGKGAMPPKGGAANASEEDIRAAVEYMVQSVQ